MRRVLLVILLLVLMSLSCQAVMGRFYPSPAAPPTQWSRFSIQKGDQTAEAETITPPAISKPSLQEEDHLPGISLQTATVSEERPLPEYATKTPSSLELFEVQFHPDGPLFVGDQVSLEVIPQKPENFVGESQVEVSVLGRAERGNRVEPENAPVFLGKEKFTSYGIGGRTQATFLWVWDTSQLEPGRYLLEFTIQPGGLSWRETVSFLPAEQVPPPEPQAQWESVQGDCCTWWYITGTEAERDFETLAEASEEQARTAARLLGTDFEEKIPITFLPRVLGHGGFAGDEISVSYLDRDYAGGDVEIVILHEMIHLLDRRLPAAERPSLLAEGLAVFLSGGHFKKEPLAERAAALLDPEQGCIQAEEYLDLQTRQEVTEPVCGLGTYVPLQSLLDNFYFAQHEIGYLQAGAFVQFLVEKMGWEAFDAFYRDIQPLKDEKGEVIQAHPSEIVDRALQKHFNMDLGEIEGDFLVYLKEQSLSPEWAEDVRLTIAFYDTVRRYQMLLDPSAYFLYAWLPGNQEMREKGIVADYLRRPGETENLLLEELLVAADDRLRRGEYEQVSSLLEIINQRLNQFENGRK